MGVSRLMFACFQRVGPHSKRACSAFGESFTFTFRGKYKLVNITAYWRGFTLSFFFHAVLNKNKKYIPFFWGGNYLAQWYVMFCFALFSLRGHGAWQYALTMQPSYVWSRLLHRFYFEDDIFFSIQAHFCSFGKCNGLGGKGRNWKECFHLTIFFLKKINKQMNVCETTLV